MNFWKILRRVGHIVLAVLAVITLIAAIVRNPDATESGWKALTGSGPAQHVRKPDTTGL